LKNDPLCQKNVNKRAVVVRLLWNILAVQFFSAGRKGKEGEAIEEGKGRGEYGWVTDKGG